MEANIEAVATKGTLIELIETAALAAMKEA